MKKLISKTKQVCPKCGKKGMLKVFDSGDSFCEHKRFKSDHVFMGQHVWEVEGCMIPKEKAPSPENA